MRPLFVRDKAYETPLTEPLIKGANTLNLDNSGGDFVVGDYIFIANADGQEAEYLGGVTEAGTDYIKVTYGAGKDRASGSLVWKPQYVLEWEVGRSSPLLITYYSGVDMQRTIGGVLYSTRVSEPYTKEVVTFDKVSRNMFLSYESWFKTVINRGLEQFTWVDEWRRVGKVKILNTELLHKEQYPQIASIELQLTVIEEGAYF